ncbi:enoyl-ACP reductase [Buchnera aphidicola]|uniref:enoyl-ACP reductase FabI n=1 Tax=Buchnera aphidicola TaxID=9 RepID=UPI003463A7A3
MGFLKGKKILISGISNEKSVAFGIFEAMSKQKAELGLICQNKKIINKIKPLVPDVPSNLFFSCDVSNDNSIKELFYNVRNVWKKFDGFVHAIAYCPRKQLSDNFINHINKVDFNITNEISVYSFLAMIKECKDMLNKDSSLLTLTSIGAQQVVSNYNLMGIAKASLESSVRYIASILGKYYIRVNAISCGPVRTRSSYVIKNFNQFKKNCKSRAFIKKDITSLDIGNIASFLSSNLSKGITGSIIYVDHGFHASRKNGLI